VGVPLQTPKELQQIHKSEDGPTWAWYRAACLWYELHSRKVPQCNKRVSAPHAAKVSNYL